MSGLSDSARGASDAEGARVSLEDRATRLRELLDYVEEGVFVYAIASGRVLDVNARACELFGYPAEDLRRRTITELSAIDEGFTEERFFQSMDVAKRDGKARIDWRAKRQDGSLFWSEIVLRRSHAADDACIYGFVRDVGALRSTLQQLRLVEERYRLLVRNLPDSAIMLCDRDLRLVLVDGPEVEACGNSKEGMEGRTIYETLAPEFVALVEGNMRRVLAGETFSAEIPFGDRFHLYQYVPLRDDDGTIVYGLILALNVTERRHAIEALRASEDRFRSLSEATFEGIGITDAGVVLDVNDQFAAMFGCSRDEMIGRSVFDFVAPESQAVVADRIRSNLVEPYEHLARRIDGSIFPVETRARRAEIGGKTVRVTAIRDMTKRKEADVERERLIAELKAKNAEMEQFANTVSHDLKSPLVTINGFLGLLERDLGAGDAVRVSSDFARIGSAAKKMMRLLDDLLALSRVGRVGNPSMRLSLRDVVNEAIELVSGSLAERGVKVVVAPDLPEIFCDRVRLVQVMQNLIENAVKYMSKESDPRVEIGVRSDPLDVVVFVRDNGIGIDPRFHERIFGLFEKLDPRSEGTGVGLALVRRILAFHGGSVHVESDGRHGSTFVVRLPRGPTPGPLEKGGVR